MAVETTGLLLADRYRVIRRLGTGGMATVFLAEDERLGRLVAVKRLHAGTSDDVARRFRREARVGAALNHPNIVVVFDTVPDPEGVLIVMEYVDGETLRAAINRGPLAPERALRVLSALAAALDYAHANGVVHRDVSPSNVLLGRDGSIKLADLGIATAAEATRITMSGTVLGTVAYIAPERLDGEAGDAAADVYAVAAVTYEALSGRKAFEGRSAAAVARRVVVDPPPDLREVVSDAPASAAEALIRGMAKDPSERPPSATELVRVLARAYAEQAAAAAEAPAAEAAPAAAAAAGLAVASAAADARAAEPQKRPSAGAAAPEPEAADVKQPPAAAATPEDVKRDPAAADVVEAARKEPPADPRPRSPVPQRVSSPAPAASKPAEAARKQPPPASAKPFEAARKQPRAAAPAEGARKQPRATASEKPADAASRRAPAGAAAPAAVAAASSTRAADARPSGPSEPPPFRTIRSRGGWSRRRLPLVAAAALLAVVAAVLAATLPGGGRHVRTAARRAQPTASARPSSRAHAAPVTPAAPPAGQAAAPAAAAPASPAQTLTDFYAFAARGDIAGAWALGTPRVHAEVGGFDSFRAQEQSLRSIAFPMLRTTQTGPASATVAFRSVAVHTARTDHCTGAATLVLSGGRWLVDALEDVACTP